MSAFDLPRSDLRRIDWTLGPDWFIAVGAVHGLIACALGTFVSVWWILPCAASCAYKMRGASRREAYVLLAREDAVEVRRDGVALHHIGASDTR